MTCYECMHINVCKAYEPEEADCSCNQFKNKADFVEVVRCKDCKFAYKNRFLGEHYCEKTNTKIKQIHFCSLGIRRTEIKERF